jgi:hypothetical protein
MSTLQSSAPAASGDGEGKPESGERKPERDAAEKTANAKAARLEVLIEEALRTGNGGNPYHDHANGKFSSADIGGDGGGDAGGKILLSAKPKSRRTTRFFR